MTETQERIGSVVVVGGGAAGLMAAISAAESGAKVLVLEKNPRPGVKILMSGGSRCNITHHCDNRGIVAAYGTKGKFLHSPLAAFSTRDAVDFFESQGVPTKVEETGKVFPVSNRASDVLQALLTRAENLGVSIHCLEAVQAIEKVDGYFQITSGKATYKAPTLILTTGGKSFPRCGTTGDGYAFANQMGHTILPTRPSLVPIALGDRWAKDLSGITIPDMALSLYQHEEPGKPPKRVGSSRGSLLFTHVGITGPCPLNLTRLEAPWEKPDSIHLKADFLPQMNDVQVDQWILDGSRTHGKRTILSLLSEILPRRLSEALLTTHSIADSKLSEFSKQNRAALVLALKKTGFQVTGTLGFDKAEVTSGGVALEEVDFKTMQSMIVPGLFLAGEILDLDGPIGGFNFQAAWSTGWLAGKNACKLTFNCP